MRQFAYICLMALLILAGCRQAAEQASAPPPIQAQASEAEPDLLSADQVARLFLDAWQANDFDAMHSLLTYRNRELRPLDEFRALYQNAHDKMSLESIDYKPKTLTSEGSVLMLQYDMTFHTRILGSFDDNERLLHLVVDSQVGGWRVAWSEADIFPEMGQGARLVFEAQIPSRANIYDRYGKALADQNGSVARILVDNGRIPDRGACFEILAQALNKPQEEITELFDLRSGADWIVDAGTIEPSAYIKFNDRIEEPCGANFQQQPTRRYLDGGLMPHVLGHVGYPDADQIEELEAIGFNAETIIGKGSIEASMNEILAGRPGGRLSLVGTDGRRIRVLSEVRSQIPQSIWLTIDSDLQAEVIRLLEGAYERGPWAEDSDGAAVVIMDVNNGEILAMVSQPSYDNNIFNPFPSMGREEALLSLKELVEDERSPQLNRATQGNYPTGSVMKGLSAIAALESGVYDENTRYLCTGSWAYGADLRYDWLRSGHGIMSAQSGITNSCNPFFYEVGFRLNAKDPWLLSSYALKLGLGQPTGVEVIPEVIGNVPTPDNITRFTGLPWSYAHAVNLSIGTLESLVAPPPP